MADWFATLRGASFNGLPFYVSTGEVEAGHRVNTTLVPNGGHVLESFGAKARAFTVEAYLTGDDCYARVEALLAAAESQHAGVLVLPDSGAHRVRLTKAQRKFEKDKLGYAALTLEAVGEPDVMTGGASVFALQQQVYALASGLSAGFGAFAAGGYRLSRQPVTVVEAAISASAGVLADLEALRLGARLSPAGDAALAPAFDAALAGLAGMAGAPAGFGSAVSAAAVALGDAVEPLRFAQALRDAGPPADAAAPVTSTGTALVIAENAGIAVALTAAARALALGEALARADYRDRAQASETRAIAMAVFDDALSRAGRAGLDMARDLAAMRGVVAELIYRQQADLAPLITVRTNARLPGLWWAWRLYGDPTRAEDLARRAGARHPAFMPEGFEALSA